MVPACPGAHWKNTSTCTKRKRLRWHRHRVRNVPSLDLFSSSFPVCVQSHLDQNCCLKPRCFEFQIQCVATWRTFLFALALSLRRNACCLRSHFTDFSELFFPRIISCLLLCDRLFAAEKFHKSDDDGRTFSRERERRRARASDRASTCQSPPKHLC